MKTFDQKSQYHSPWTLRQRLAMLMWSLCWGVFCAWTPKPLNRWRLLWLRLFGADIRGVPFVHQRAQIQIPWNLTMHDRSCLGDGTTAYSLGEIEIGPHATVAQEAYLCTGTHDFSKANLPLQVSKIFIGAEAFIGVRALILPGIQIGGGAVVGGGSVVTRDVPERTIVAGNPARVIRQRSPAEQLHATV